MARALHTLLSAARRLGPQPRLLHFPHKPLASSRTLFGLSMGGEMSKREERPCKVHPDEPATAERDTITFAVGWCVLIACCTGLGGAVSALTRIPAAGVLGACSHCRFWTPEDKMARVQGVLATRVGYTGGTKSSGVAYRSMGDHTEACQVDFDPRIVSYQKMLDLFFSFHNPYSNKSSRQYRNCLWYAGGVRWYLSMRPSNTVLTLCTCAIPGIMTTLRRKLRRRTLLR